MSAMPRLSDAERTIARRAVADAAAALVADGMVVGLGSGDTARIAVRALAARSARERFRVTGVATSERTAALARSLGVPLVDLDAIDRIDMTVDGADEVDPDLRLIKGRGGALLREKMIARASARVVILVDADKTVGRLGERVRLPVEIVPFGSRHTLRALAALGVDPVLRLDGGEPARTDGGNHLADVRIPPGGEIDALDRALKLTAGVIETGLFATEASDVLVGTADGTVRHLRRRAGSR